MTRRDAIFSLIASSIARGEVQWSVGRLLSGETRDGAMVALDPTSGTELGEGNDPAFILATEGEATDDNILRMHWDLSRVDGAGAPVLWNHDPDELLGTWRDVSVMDLDTGAYKGPGLVGRARFSRVEPDAAKRKAQVREGTLRGVSVGWIPGARVRRGSLKEDDPLWREPVDDDCGSPMEGYVMGTAAEPNVLIEASLTPTPADARAVALERMRRTHTAMETLSRGERAPARDVDVAAVMLAIRNSAGLRTWLRNLLAEDAEIRAILRDLTTTPTAQPSRWFGRK